MLGKKVETCFGLAIRQIFYKIIMNPRVYEKSIFLILREVVTTVLFLLIVSIF